MYTRDEDNDEMHVSHIGGGMIELNPPPKNCVFLEADVYDAKVGAMQWQDGWVRVVCVWWWRGGLKLGMET